MEPSFLCVNPAIMEIVAKAVAEGKGEPACQVVWGGSPLPD